MLPAIKQWNILAPYLSSYIVGELFMSVAFLLMKVLQRCLEKVISIVKDQFMHWEAFITQDLNRDPWSHSKICADEGTNL